jgi:tetratricopeptide (TPR) repeat protein
MTDVQLFLSHSHHDNLFCQRLVDAVRVQLPGADIFYDKEKLVGGDDWIARIQYEVIRRPVFVVVLSIEAVRAEWVREETNLALRLAVKDLDRRIIPVQHQESDVNSLAPLLGNRQIVDCATQSEAFGFAQLVAALQAPTAGALRAIDPAYEDARRRTAEVHDLYAAGNWREAARLGRFASTLPGNERDAELWGELGVALIRLGQAGEGVDALQRALQINRFRADLWREVAQAQVYWLRQPDAAIHAWDMALAATATPQGKFDLYTEECEALNYVGRWQDALALNGEAGAINPRSPRIWVSRGDSLLFLNRADDALQAFDSALRLDPTSAPATRGKAFALVQRGDYAGALPLCDQFLQRYPRDASVWSNRAKALAGMGNFAEAQRSLDSALGIEPGNPVYLGERAEYFLRMGQPGLALPWLDRALEINPNAAQMWRAKATALHHLRRFDEARAAELCALELEG